jgi:hypothetical protein
MIVAGTSTATQRARIADLNGEARAPDPQIQIVCRPLRLNLISHVPNAQREHIPTSENGIHVEIPAVQTAGPVSLNTVEVKPVILPVDGYVIDHEKPLSVAGCQLLSLHKWLREGHGFRHAAQSQ